MGRSFPAEHALNRIYAAPERLAAADNGVPCFADAAVDAWGLGMTVHWLLTGLDYVPGSGYTIGAVEAAAHAAGRNGTETGGGDGKWRERSMGDGVIAAIVNKDPDIRSKVGGSDHGSIQDAAIVTGTTALPPQVQQR